MHEFSKLMLFVEFSHGRAIETQDNTKQIEKQNSACSFMVKLLDTSKLSKVVSVKERSQDLKTLFESLLKKSNYLFFIYSYTTINCSFFKFGHE